MARISRKVEVPSTLTLRVEVKEPTEDEKHSGSDHPRRFSHISILLHSELGEEVNCSSQHTWRTIEYDVCDLAIQASTTNQSINQPPAEVVFNSDFLCRSSLMGTTLRAAPSKRNAFSTNYHACIHYQHNVDVHLLFCFDLHITCS